MKRSVLLGLFVAMAPAVQVLNAGSAPVTLTVQSYRALTNAVVQVVDTVAPGSAGMWLADLREGLGISGLEGIDLDRPWQLAVWLEGTQGSPSISVRIPTTDFEAFKAGLASGSILSGFNQPEAVRPAGDYANIWIQTGAASGASESAHAAWKPADLPPAGTVLGLEIKPGDPLREQILGALAMVRMMVVGMMVEQGQNVPGVDAQAMSELMGAYFDVAQVALRGLETLKLGLDVRGDEITLTETVTAKSNSELASWLDAGEGSLDSVIGYASTDLPLALAMRWDRVTAGFMPTLKKFARLSLQLQGVAASDDAVTQMEELLDAAIPMRFGGGLDFSEGFIFSGVYQFPGRDLGRIHELMRRYFEGPMQQQVGGDQLYKSISFKEGARKLDSVPVDRVTMELNLESPLYEVPGQKEMIERMWPGGRMVIDQARRGDRWFMGSPAALDRLLAGAPTAQPVVPASLNPHTVLFGRVNLLKLLPAMLEGNPMVPDEAAAQLRRADSAGTEMTLQIDLTGSALIARSVVPLKFLRSVAQAMQ
jgi:hypothetical protein